jgi:RND family efflux transporter MFP subunit
MKKVIAVLLMILVVVFVIMVLKNNKEKMNARFQQNLNLAPTVSTAKIEKKTLKSSLSVIGTTAANHDVMIISETIGRVVQAKADVGDRVTAGSVVIQVDDELKLASFKTAEVNYEKSKKDLERFESLYQSKSLTDSELESGRLAFKAAEAQYIAARKQYNDTRITTPISGIIAQRMVDVGSMVQPGMPVINIVDISLLKVLLHVSEEDVFKVKPGDTATITTDVYHDVTFEGKVKNISSKGDDSHTYRVELTLKNSESNPLKSGMFVRVEFPMIEKKNILVTPREALLGSKRDPKVYVVENNVARLRSIVIGQESGYDLEVVKGLHQGERVVINGQNNLRDGIPVTIIQ